MFILKLLGIIIPILISQVFCEKKPLLIDKLRWDFLEMENELWNLSSNGLVYNEQSNSELYLAKKFYDFDQKMKQMPEDILRGMDPIRTFPNFLFLYSELKAIENKYEKFREYQNNQINQSPDKIMMDDIVYDILNNKTGISKSIDKVEEYSISIGEELLQMAILSICDLSAQQAFYNYYNVIAFNELKAYIMQQFSHLGNRLWSKGNNIELSILTRKRYEMRVNKMTGNPKKLFPLIRKDIWRCDPEHYVKGITYEEFTRLLQGHVQNEADMSSRRTCRNTCNEYSYTKSYGCYDYKSEFCRKVEKCNGAIIGCRFIESDATICLAKTGSPRRYEYVKYDSGKTLGSYSNCKGTVNQKKFDSWTRWFVRCHYCMCLCDEHGSKSDRYINLRPVMADVQNNRVVTGLRLIKHNRMLHLQIQEGKLLPYGYINESTVHWVPVDNFKITDSGVSNGEDFFTMTYEHRSMALDEIQVNEDNYIVTGVRFDNIKNRVHFEIHVSPFDWSTGTVQKNGYYIFETNPNGRDKIDLHNSNVPIKALNPSKIRQSHTNLYVEFTHSDFGKDAAQTTIPFIDIQDVINKPAVPLMGAGIYYKGSDDYGGFIGPLIKTYDFGKHISNLVPMMGNRVDVSDDISVEVN